MRIARLCVRFVMLVPANAYLIAQSTLWITSPPDGTVVNPGQVIGIQVSASGPPLKGVGVLGPHGLGSRDVEGSGPYYQFDVEIPKEIRPGLYPLTALGSANPSDLVMSKPVMIDVERPDLPVKITTNSNSLRLRRLEIGEQLVIGVSGTYADGSVVDLGKSTQTTFASQSPAIAMVSKDGWVTAVGPGSTHIIINGSISIPVTVPPLLDIKPMQATLKASEEMYFAATVTSLPDRAVTWSLNPPVGTVENGRYTAPAALDSQQTVTITATSVADPRLTASAAITLSPVASIKVLPAWAVLYEAQLQQFTATAANAGGAGVKWSVEPSGAGTINANGMYMAPRPISATQKVTIKATSIAKPTLYGSTDIWISPRPFIVFPFPKAVDLTSAQSATVTMTLLTTERFFHRIALSVVGVPIGVKAEFSKATLTGNSQSSLTFTIENETAPGTYNLRVVGQDADYPPMTSSEPLILTIRH